jgi:hypothetical protein
MNAPFFTGPIPWEKAKDATEHPRPQVDLFKYKKRDHSELPLTAKERMLKELEELEERSRKQYKIDDFVYDARNERYWNVEDLVAYSEKSVNRMIPKSEWERDLVPGRNGSTRELLINPSSSIARIESGNVVESVVWWPGMPRIINDVLVTDDGIDMYAPRRRALNTYRAAPQQASDGDPALAAPWVEHVRQLWPGECEVLLDYFAHTVQKPQEKINFGIILNGEPGIGKDLALLPVRRAIGEWNCREETPSKITSNFNGWVNCVLLTINEAKPTESEFKATDFYEVLKPCLAAPPNWLPRNGKYEKQFYVRNVLRVIITTNDALALYVPENDRRLFFAKSELPAKWAEGKRAHELVGFYNAGGYAHVFAYLRQRDISKFNPHIVPAQTAAQEAVAASWTQAVYDPLRDVLDDLGWPPLFFGGELLSSEVAAFDNKDEVRILLQSSRKTALRMNRLGYQQQSSPHKSNGWKFSENGKVFRTRVVFVKHGFGGDIEAEIDRRGREIAACGKAARPKVVSIKEAK